MLPQPEKTSVKRVLLAPAIVLVVLIAAFVGGISWMQLRAAGSTPIFHQTKSGWQQLPAPLAYLQTLRVSSNGTVWARTLGAGIVRLDGKVWKYYTRRDLGVKTDYSQSALALDGEQVWAPTQEGILHWDGQRWQLYKEAPTSEAAAIVAGGGQVWVVDHTGKFSHFQEGQWKSQKLELPGVNWEVNPDDGVVPQLARTANGVVWLMWQGLWKLDGAKWTQVSDGKSSLTHLIGAAGDRLWLSGVAGLHSLSMDGKHWAYYTPEQIGLSQFATIAKYVIHDVTSASGRTLFGTSAGLFEFDGSQWRKLSLPSQRIAGAQSIAASADGELWVLGFSLSGSTRPYRYLFLLIGLLPIAILCVVIWTFQRFRRRQLQQHQLVAQAVQHATGEIPYELQHGERSLKWSGGVVTLVMIFGAGVAFYFVRRVWPQAPWWLVPVFAIAIRLAATFQQSLVKRAPKPSDPIGPGAPSTYDWGKPLKAVAGMAIIIAIVNADMLPMLKFLRGYYFWLLIFVPVGYNALMIYLMNGAMRRGDYERGLNIIRWFHFYNPSGIEPLRMSGHILVAAGRYQEAEDTLRRSLVSSHARQSYGQALEYLGDALMEQGRYDEATRSYEAALHAFAWRLRPYRGMAEMLLRRGGNPQQALEYVEKIIDFSGLSAVQRSGNGRPQDDYWALKAWALAAIGRTSEVAGAIESAVKATDSKCLPDLATTYYRAGMAMQAMGNQSVANQHFRRAIELDPNGRRGTLSKGAMRERMAWGVPVRV
jgi:tetratricopeptide (TPR) repeat protein